MANGNGGESRLADAWAPFDEPTRLGLAINELDRVYVRLGRITGDQRAEHATTRSQITDTVAAVKADFHERLTAVRTELGSDIVRLEEQMTAGFAAVERRQNRNNAWLLTAVGGILVGLVLLVANLSAGM